MLSEIEMSCSAIDPQGTSLTELQSRGRECLGWIVNGFPRGATRDRGQPERPMSVKQLIRQAQQCTVGGHCFPERKTPARDGKHMGRPGEWRAVAQLHPQPREQPRRKAQ